MSLVVKAWLLAARMVVAEASGSLDGHQPPRPLGRQLIAILVTDGLQAVTRMAFRELIALLVCFAIQCPLW